MGTAQVAGIKKKKTELFESSTKPTNQKICLEETKALEKLHQLQMKAG